MSKSKANVSAGKIDKGWLEDANYRVNRWATGKGVERWLCQKLDCTVKIDSRRRVRVSSEDGKYFLSQAEIYKMLQAFDREHT